MKKWLALVESDCKDPSREIEFNEWYNEVHIPDMLELPAVVGAERYENPNADENSPKYLAIYKVETDNIARVMDEVGKHVEQKAKQGQICPSEAGIYPPKLSVSNFKKG